MNVKIEFGQFISEKRQKLSMESQELAKALGISNAYLSQLEKDIRTHPSSALFNKMLIEEIGTIFYLFSPFMI